ncbi:MAG: ATP-binding cassette domain-containing protein [Pseudomonadota bacterium]
MLEKSTVKSANIYKIYDRNSPNSFLPLLCRNLTYRAEKRNLIDDLNLSIDSPGITVVLGFNGAGKSLLLRLLHGDAWRINRQVQIINQISFFCPVCEIAT